MTELSPMIDAVGLLDRAFLGKARLPSALTETGLLRQIMAEAKALSREVGKTVKEVMPLVRQSANIDWPNASAAQIDSVIEEASRLMQGLPSQFLPGTRAVMNERGQVTAQDTRRALRKRHKQIGTIPASLSLEDRRAIDAISETTSMFFSPEYERQARRFGERTQKTIARSLEQGFGRREIADQLASEFSKSAIHRSYWETVASVHVGRARSFSAVSSMVEAGFTRYQILAVNDERTTEICRFMDGKEFSLRSAMRSFDAFENADTLEEVQTRVAPFMRVQNSEDGKRIVLPNGRPVATISSGKTTAEMTDKQMNGAGVNTPPYHFRCRTTIVPVLGE